MKNNSKKGGLLKLGLLVGAGALIYNELTKGSTNRSANVGNAIAGAINTTDAAELIKTIDGSPALQAYFKRLLGTTSPTVQELVTYINNSYNLDGVQYQTFGNSLLTNGAGELGNVSNNENCSYSIQEGKSVFTQNADDYIKNVSNVPFVPDRLYRHTFYSKGLGSIYAFIVNQDISGNVLNKVLNNWAGAYSVFGVTSTLGFTKKIGYVGGIDTNAVSQFHPNTHSFKYVSVYHSGGGSIHSQIFELLPLSEPVPSNLPWLPVGQEVKDPTTGDRGTYNGTTIDWYTMV